MTAGTPTRPLWADVLPRWPAPVTATQATGAGAVHADVCVVGVDAGVPGGGASGRNGGFLLAGAADFHHVLARRVGARATALYRRALEVLSEEIAVAGSAVRRTGSIRLAVDAEEARDCRRMARVMRRDNLPVEEDSGAWGAGLRFPADAAMHPGRRIAALVGHARAAGCRLLVDAPVERVTDGAVHARNLTVLAERVLVAVDGGLELVLPQLAGEVRTARAQMLATGPHAVSGALVAAPVYARHGYDYWQHLPEGTVALGGGRDLGGTAEWTVEDGVTAPVQRHLDHLLRERLSVDTPVRQRWSGRLGFTPDRMPLCRLLTPRVAVAGGYCGTGNVIGPMAARAAVRLLLDGRADAELFAG